jgi:hypothetical protein
MSLVTVWTNERFAAVCCDGRLSRRGENGRLIPVSEHYAKFHVLAEDIVLAVTGSQFIDDRLARCLEAFTREHRDSPDLFMYLETVISLNVRALLALGAELFDAPLEAALVLIGYDAAQKRIRNLSWNSHDDLVPLEQSNTVGAIGNDDGVPIARDQLKTLRDGTRDDLQLEDVLPAMERVVTHVSELVPWSVNKNTRSYLVGVPELRGERKAKGLDKIRCSPEYGTQSALANEAFGNVVDGTRSAWDSAAMKTAAVDTAGNLKLKNVNDVVGTTAAPSASSTTFVVVPEMTQTLTFKGNKVLLLFQCMINIPASTAGSIVFAFFKDGVQLSGSYPVTYFTGNGSAAPVIGISMAIIDSPSAASHTYDVRWEIIANGCSANGTNRRFQIVELG